MIMECLVFALIAFGASTLTFFTGFGLGTILTPVFMFYFPVDTAIALTGFVHFFNNLFKWSLIGGKANQKVLLFFGVPAVLFAFLGAWLLSRFPLQNPLFTYHLLDRTIDVYPLKCFISFLIIVFVVLDILPSFKKMALDIKFLPLGGALSGFFGGLSGHQGALRSVFLVKTGMSKEAFVATTVVLSTCVDLTRLSVYATAINLQLLVDHMGWMLAAVSGALLGAVLGMRLLKKMTLPFLEKLVAILLLLYSLLMAAGLL